MTFSDKQAPYNKVGSVFVNIYPAFDFWIIYHQGVDGSERRIHLELNHLMWVDIPKASKGFLNQCFILTLFYSTHTHLMKAIVSLTFIRAWG